MAAFVPVTVTGTRDGRRDAEPENRFAVGHYVVPFDRPTDPPDLVRITQNGDSMNAAESDPVSAVGPSYVDWLNAAANVSVELSGACLCSCPACGAWAGLCDCPGPLRRAAYAAAAVAESDERDAGRTWNVPPSTLNFVPWAVLSVHHHASGRSLSAADPDARRKFADELRPLFAAGFPVDPEAAGMTPLIHTDPEDREIRSEAGGVALHHLPWVPLPKPCGEYSGTFTLAERSGDEDEANALCRAYFVRKRLGRPHLTGVMPQSTGGSADSADLFAGLFDDSPYRLLSPHDYAAWVLQFTSEARRLFEPEADGSHGTPG